MAFQRYFFGKKFKELSINNDNIPGLHFDFIFEFVETEFRKRAFFVAQEIIPHVLYKMDDIEEQIRLHGSAINRMFDVRISTGVHVFQLGVCTNIHFHRQVRQNGTVTSFVNIFHPLKEPSL